jgi:hypothetical protein
MLIYTGPEAEGVTVVVTSANTIPIAAGPVLKPNSDSWRINGAGKVWSGFCRPRYM